MVVTKLTKRKRKPPHWLGNDVYPILDLTEDGDESESRSVSGVNSCEDGNRSPAKTVDASLDREVPSDDQEEDNLEFFSPAKDSPNSMDSSMEVQSQENTELEDHIERNASQIALPIESIQPPAKINGLYMKFSAQAVEIRGGDEESMIHEWSLGNIARIGFHYLSEEEEDTRAFVAVTVSVPLCSLSRSTKESGACLCRPRTSTYKYEYLLLLSKFRDSVDGISKLSPIFGVIFEEIEKEDVEKIGRTIKMQNSQTSNSLFSSSSEELMKGVDAFKVLVYPPDDPDAVTITRKDIVILKPFEFLNDTIIDFYIKYLQQTVVSPEKLKTLQFFNSFFFSKLAEAGGAAAFERVKKWTKKVDVFEKDFVFIPVNQSLHWSLIIICHPGHIWEVPAIDGSFDGDACILHLDSMEGSHKGIDAHIRNYLFQEWIERNRDPEEAPYVGEFFSGMPYMYSKVPQQDNNCDCGLFLLHYVELFLKEAPPVYRTRRQRNPPTEFLRRNWFKPSEASAKRRVIQKLIFELSQVRSLESVGDHTNMKENGEVPVDEQLTRTSPIPLQGEKQRSSQSAVELGPVHSDPLKKPLIENCSHDRSKPMELLGEVKLGHVEGSTESSECDDQSKAHISAENDGLRSRPGEIWNWDRCPTPRLPFQIKPLQIPDEEVQMRSQPPSSAAGVEASEASDEVSSSYFTEDSRRSKKERRLLDFDGTLSPKLGFRKFRKSAPFGRCSGLSAPNHKQRKQPEKDRTRRGDDQPRGSLLYSNEVHEIEELSSDDSDSSKRWNFKETGQRVTRSKTQASQGLSLSAKKQATRDALDLLLRR